MKRNNKLTTASKTYSSNIALRGLVNLIPYVGSTLDVVFCEKWNRITARRIDDFINFTKREFEKIEDKMINKEYLESEDFADLTVKCLTGATKTRHKEKIELYAKVLKNAATSKDFDLNEFEEILPTFEQISIRELTVLSHLYKWEYNLNNNYTKMLGYSEVRISLDPSFPPGIPVYHGFWDAFLDEVSNRFKISKEDSEYLLQTSSQKGLFIFESYNTSKNNIYAGRESFDHHMKGRLTPLFSKFKKYVFAQSINL